MFVFVKDTPKHRTLRTKGTRRKTRTDTVLFYWRIHRWLENKYGKPNMCENKNCEHKSKRFEWALKKNCKYRKNRNNFLRLCKACHVIYDFTDSWAKNISKGKTGIKRKCPWMILRNKRKDIIQKISETRKKNKILKLYGHDVCTN